MYCYCLSFRVDTWHGGHRHHHHLQVSHFHQMCTAFGWCDFWVCHPLMLTLLSLHDHHRRRRQHYKCHYRYQCCHYFDCMLYRRCMLFVGGVEDCAGMICGYMMRWLGCWPHRDAAIENVKRMLVKVVCMREGMFCFNLNLHGTCTVRCGTVFDSEYEQAQQLFCSPSIFINCKSVFFLNRSNSCRVGIRK